MSDSIRCRSPRRLIPPAADDVTRIQSVFSSNNMRLEDSSGNAWTVVGRNITNGNGSLDAGARLFQ